MNLQYSEMTREDLIQFVNANIARIKALSPMSDQQISEELSIKAIMDYLENPGCSPSYLKLAPGQVDHHPNDNQLACFKQVVNQCKTLSEVRKNVMMANFQYYYPHIFQRILDDATTQIVVEEKNKPNPYKIISEKLIKEVVGQEQAAKLLASLLTTQTSLSKNHVFLFVGPTGVGKTELAKAVSKIKNRFVTFPMNQYQNEMDFSQFFGSGPGFVGSTDKSHFAKKLDEGKPTYLGMVDDQKLYEVEGAVILFDEFEKAHSKIKQSLLTLFDEWIYTASYTEDRKNVSIKYKFKNCVIINTSNLYQDQILQAFHNRLDVTKIADQFKTLNHTHPTLQSYSPELLGRMSVIPFGPISRGVCYQSLVKKQLENLINELRLEFKFKEIVIENELTILTIIENKLYGQGTNIRKIHEYFSIQIKEIFHQNKSEWGDLKKVKLTFYSNQGKVFIKAMLFLEDFNLYNNVGTSIELP